LLRPEVIWEKGGKDFPFERKTDGRDWPQSRIYFLSFNIARTSSLASAYGGPLAIALCYIGLSMCAVVDLRVKYACVNGGLLIETGDH
jgi:hypothetical protein